MFTEENTSLKDPSTPSHSPNKEATNCAQSIRHHTGNINCSNINYNQILEQDTLTVKSSHFEAYKIRLGEEKKKLSIAHDLGIADPASALDVKNI